MKQETFIYLICGLAGVLFHSLLKYQSLRTDAMKANLTFPLIKYISQDWPGILLAVLPVFVWLFTFGEAAAKYPLLRDFTRVSFVLAGMVGSYVLQLVMSRSKKQIRDVIDKKTDIADESPNA